MGKRLGRWNMWLGISVLAFVGTLAYGIQSKVLWGFPTPKHLMTNDKKPVWNTDPDAMEKEAQKFLDKIAEEE